MSMKIRAACLMLLAILAGGTPAATTAQFQWQQEPGSVALLHNDRVVWKFNYGTNAAKPFFHPVALLDGTVLTVDRPSDHRWHHGLWFSWKFINGVNYWEENPATGQSAGLTSWSQPQIETRPDFSAHIVLDLVYRPGEGKPVLTEKRVIEVSPPDESGVYGLDWTLAFTAVDQDALLDRTPLPGEPGGQPWGGYAGLSVRLAKGIKDSRLATTEGPAAFVNTTYRGKAMGLDYSGRLAEREGGIAILDSPGNLNSPTPWYAIDNGSMDFFSAAVIQYHSQALKAGQTLNLRYRAIIHPGRWEAGQLRRAAEPFVSPKKP